MQSPYLQLPPYLPLTHQVNIPLALITPGLSTAQLETISIAQSPQNYSDQPVLNYLCCPDLPFSLNYNKGSRPCCLLTLLPTVQTE